MEKPSVLSKILAVAGTIFAWFPIAAPILIAILSLIIDRRFRFDYLMPAELFPAALIGGGLLIWAAVRTRSRRALIGGGFGAAIALLALGQGLAVVTGLASGEREAAGWPLAVVLGAIILYAVALVVVAVGGVLLVRDVFKRQQPMTAAV